MKHQNARHIIPKIISTLVLAGCASAPPSTQIVEVPVRVECLGKVPPRPAYQVENLGLYASDGQKVLALAADWPLGRKYEGLLEAAIEGCR